MAQEKTTKTSLVREFSAGGAVYKKGRGVRWLIIRPLGTDRWQLPKGHIEDGERAQETAVREIFEETGIRARIIDRIDTTRYFYVLNNKRIAKSVAFFLMEHESGEATIKQKAREEIGEVLWVDTKEAIKLLTFTDDKEIIRKAQERLEKGVQVNLI